MGEVLPGESALPELSVDTGVTVLVVHPAFIFVGQDLVRLGDFLELRLGDLLGLRRHVRMILLRQTAIGLLDLVGGRGLGYS